MKKEYVKPDCEHITFAVREALMGDIGIGSENIGDDVEDWD